MSVEQNFNFQCAHIGLAKIDPLHVIGSERFGEPILRIPVECHFHHQGDSVRTCDFLFGSPIARLFFNNRELARAQPIGGSALCAKGFTANQRWPMELEFPISERQLEQIELQRTGNLGFKVFIQVTVTRFGFREDSTSVKGTAAGAFGVEVQEVSSVDLNFELPTSRWTETVLPSLGYGRILVVELPVFGLDSLSTNERALKALENSNRLFRKGEYDHAVGSCRVALEGFLRTNPAVASGSKNPQGKKLKDEWRQRLGDATAEWIEKCMLRTSQETNHTHHDPSGAFNRLDAQMVILITTGLIAHILQEKPLREPSDSAPSVPS